MNMSIQKSQIMEHHFDGLFRAIYVKNKLFIKSPYSDLYQSTDPLVHQTQSFVFIISIVIVEISNGFLLWNWESFRNIKDLWRVWGWLKVNQSFLHTLNFISLRIQSSSILHFALHLNYKRVFYGNETVFQMYHCKDQQ